MRKKWELIISQACRFRKICVLCHLPFTGKHALCEPCFELLPKINAPCMYCALPLPDGQTSICGMCIKQPPVIQQAIIAYPFIEPLRTLIHLFKYHQGLYLSSTLSHLIFKHLSPTSTPELLIPVPIHKKKLQERGFNQAILLTKHLSKWLSIPYDIHACEKTEHTQSQTSLSSLARKINLEHSFKVNPMPYEHVALIDDVYTTGSTTLSLAAKLRANGVKRVDVWCIARTI
jgi:ComF family protein